LLAGARGFSPFYVGRVFHVKFYVLFNAALFILEYSSASQWAELLRRDSFDQVPVEPREDEENFAFSQVASPLLLAELPCLIPHLLP
jgi:hypothetical protein